MLARPEKFRCVECGLSMEDERFHFEGGRAEYGPAYWSDRGVLCSPQCSLAHHRRRAAEGTLPLAPAPEPFDF
ncbi:hypothetical protein [Mesorhizobium xinjiangense]|uniref:hypothetical protein n=1 Tax=Mesorhizobium xinjiangense TaxID=2678685 RepID=UPI0012ECBEEE|nr:hypothetical protein [Mesorhizobium xinjiangense]